MSHNTGPRVLALVALAFDLPADFFEAPGLFDEPNITLGANHYSAKQSVPEEGLLGIGAHTDYGALTFLHTDDVPGLQIANEHGTKATALGLREAPRPPPDYPCTGPQSMHCYVWSGVPAADAC
jgi:isopenicillin N synthase-like dioxygenase